MNTELVTKIDALIESARADVVRDTITFVNMKSVRTEPAAGAPFGEDVKRVLDRFLEIAESDGFYGKDYGVGVVSAAMQDAQPDLGIWLHGDVVPAGDGWLFEPYRAVEYNGCIVGRGAGDNKGQLSAMLNLFRIFKKLGVSLNYNPAIYLGSCEETGMKDLVGLSGVDGAEGFINVCRPPKISLVPDSSFPVAYGGKGSSTFKLKSKTKISGYTFTAGQIETPGKAEAVFENCDVTTSFSGCEAVSKDGNTVVTASTPPRHSSNPSPDGNMITLLSRALLDANVIPESDRYIFEFLCELTIDIYGNGAGISTRDDSYGRLTVFTNRVDIIDGHVEVSMIILYPVTITKEEIVSALSEYARSHGFELFDVEWRLPTYCIDKSSPTLAALLEVANSVTGENGEPYIMSGGTYAHYLPNAYAFGTSANIPPADFANGRGSVHGVDEAVSIDRLIRAMKIYARALLALNDII